MNREQSTADQRPTIAPHYTDTLIAGVIMPEGDFVLGDDGHFRRVVPDSNGGYRRDDDFFAPVVDRSRSLGIDVAGDVTPHLDTLKAAGVEFIFRYGATHTHLPGKILTLTEARAISAAGFKLGAVWENGLPTTPEYFTSAQGKQDAEDASVFWTNIGLPVRTPIYFTVDCDLSYDAISSRVFNYFAAIHNAIESAYDIGVYGSGLVCEKMVDWALAKYSWLAGATEWENYREFLPRATIVQGPLPPKLRGIGLPESDSDYDVTSTDDYGGFQVPVVATA